MLGRGRGWLISPCEVMAELASLRMRVLTHELGEDDGEGTDERQRSRGRAELGDKRGKLPRREQSRSATLRPWAHGDERERGGFGRGRRLQGNGDNAG